MNFNDDYAAKKQVQCAAPLTNIARDIVQTAQTFFRQSLRYDLSRIRSDGSLFQFEGANVIYFPSRCLQHSTSEPLHLSSHLDVIQLSLQHDKNINTFFQI